MAERIPFDDKRWKTTAALQTPPDISPDRLVMVNNANSNWWHQPGREEHDGVVYGFEVDITEGIELSVEIELEGKLLATLFLQLSPHVWVKAGLELDGVMASGVVVTNPYSDWSIKEHQGGSKRMTITLKDRLLHVFEDDNRQMIRQNLVFGDGTEKKALVGVMGASPKGDGATAVYKNFTLKKGIERAETM